MERAVASLKWKTTASAACIPRRDSTSPYSMADTVFPTASRIVCSLCSGVGGPIILGCSPLLADDLYLPTPRILPLLGPAPPALEAVKRLWACYKLEGLHTPLRDALCNRSACPSTTVVISKPVWHHDISDEGGRGATDGGSEDGEIVDRGVGGGRRTPLGAFRPLGGA